MNQDRKKSEHLTSYLDESLHCIFVPNYRLQIIETEIILFNKLLFPYKNNKKIDTFKAPIYNSFKLASSYNCIFKIAFFLSLSTPSLILSATNNYSKNFSYTRINCLFMSR